MTSSVPVVLERDNVNDESVTLVRWFAGDGDQVAANSLLAEVETSKANLEIYAPAAGFLVYMFPEGADVPVSAPIGYISERAPSKAPQGDTSSPESAPLLRAADQHEPPMQAAVIAVPSGNAQTAANLEFRAVTKFKQRFSPVAAKMMEANGLTAADFAGKSIVRKQDILDHLRGPAPAPEQREPRESTFQEQRIALTPINQPYEEVALSKMKRREGAALGAGSRNAVPSAVSVLCFTRGLRRILESKATGGNASAVIVYEVSRLLRKYPALNATYRDGAMLRYDKVNIGFAMDDGRGLKVAAIHDCDILSLQQIAAKLRDLTLDYLDDKLAPVQIANATFTISDLSGMGVSSFFPLISENQSGILGVGGEQFAPGSTYGTYTLTLTFDHQLTDGRNAALFLNDLKDRLNSYEGTAHDQQQQLACSQCGRTASMLAEKGQHLLRSAFPDGYLCTLCAAGY